MNCFEGLGHYEINMTKALFPLLWDIALVDLAKLGFNSSKEQAACKSATGNSFSKYNYHKIRKKYIIATLYINKL